MTGATYPRSSGKRILPLTWRTVQARRPSDIISPDERTTWDTADEETRAMLRRLASEELTRPPEFLEFDLAPGPWTDGTYPGALPVSEGHPADGHLIGIERDIAAAKLGIDFEQLEKFLKNFSGPVRVSTIHPDGQPIYRTVGLTATGAKYGNITNRITGEYFENTTPRQYDDLITWRRKTAVKAEWNGDHGYVEIFLQEPVYALTGQIGLQLVDIPNGLCLPGGGYQICIPNFETQAPKTTRLLKTTPLTELIQPTRFRKLAR